MMEFQPLDLLHLPLKGSSLIEASAGTGKTWTLAALYVRLVLGHGDSAFDAGLEPKQMLVLTFTRAATQELRERIRERLAQTADCLRQARACQGKALTVFLDSIKDPFLRELLASCPDLDQAYQRSLRAAQSMDQAAIFTINSFCQRMLKRFAFAAGHAFEQQVQTDTTALVEQVQKDYWRHFIQPLPVALLQALAAQKFKAGNNYQSLDRPSGFGAAIRQYQVTPAEAPQQTDLPDVIGQWLPAQETLLAARQAARTALTEQRPYFLDWLDTQLESKNLKGGSYKEAPFASLNGFIDQNNLNTSNLEKFTPKGFMWAKGKEQQLPASLDAPIKLAEFLALNEALPEFPLTEWLQHAADWMAVEEDKRLDAQSSITFNTMVTHLADALNAPAGQALADALFAAYPCALIDEFQDTDQTQYGIFQRIYAERPDDAHAWFMIGDPKQSIYRFRGADIHTYLLAAAQAKQRYTLDTNFRSSAAMVEACNQLFVSSPLASAEAGIFDQADLRYRPVNANGRDSLLHIDRQPATALTLCQPTTEVLVSGKATSLLAERFAVLIAELLQQAQKGQTYFEQNGRQQPLQAHDIACLVRTGTQAQHLKQALQAQGVETVYLSDKSSVFASHTAHDLYRLLRAIAQPAEGQLARQALTCNLLAYDSDDQVRQLQNEACWAAHLQRLRQLKEVWQQQGVLPMLHRLVHLLDLPQRQRDERVLTDLFHLAELLQQASTQLDGMEALLAWLLAAINGKQAQAGDDADSGQNERQLRLENERNRVIIMTLHGSKGLEFPLVMLPFACLVEGENRRDNPDEDMRLLYVGITRATHACWLGLVPCRHGKGDEHQLESNALGRLLFGKDHPSNETMAARLEALQAGCAHIHLDTRQTEAEALPPLARASVTHCLPELPPVRRPDHWSVTSYSRLASRSQRGHFNAASERLLESGDADDVSTATTSIHHFARGRATGNVLHTLLEKLCLRGFAHIDDAFLAQLLERACQADEWQDAKPLLHDWLTRLIHTPLPLGEHQAALAEVEMALPESEFWLRLEQGDISQLEGLAHQLLPGEREPLQATQLNGMLKGFIDLLFCHEGRYYVLDYKSNYLGSDASAYTHSAMSEAMLAHRYDLQALLYQLALHRLLQQRLPDYDPDVHLGGSLFFFLRGIDSDSRGLFSLRADTALLQQLDALFDGVKEHDIKEQSA